MPTETPVTRRDIKRGLRALGLRAGDLVGVHSSLSSFGHVEGGADAVIDALRETVGKRGSVVMPTYSTNRERAALTPEDQALGITSKSRILPYDPKTTACWTGKIPDTFRRRPGALRGEHPTHSLAAIGPQASRLAQGWSALLELDGYILLLGVTLECCSALHLAEERVTLPDLIARRMRLPAHLREQYPPGQWMIGFGPYPDFVLMEGPCQQRRIMKLATIGAALARLVRLGALIDLYAECLREYPEAFYHGCVPASEPA
jgi:aminoglycoside 3-N-acetyltransferase